LTDSQNFFAATFNSKFAIKLKAFITDFTTPATRRYTLVKYWFSKIGTDQHANNKTISVTDRCLKCFF